MSIELFRRFGIFVVLVVAQVLIFNHINMFGVATPLLYVYFAVTFRRNTPKWEVLLWCFFMGLLIDIFSNTLGMASAALTLVGFLQTYLLELFVPHDSVEDLEASAETLGWGKFTIFSAVLVLVYCVVFFTLESFSFFDFLFWLQCVGGSTLLTLLLILTLETLRAR